MTSITESLARVDRARDELAKAWLVRLIERASLEEIQELPTDRIARQLPQLISDMVRAVATDGTAPLELSPEEVERAATLAALRAGPDSSPADLARDVAALQSVLVRALREEMGDSDPEAFAMAVERLADATGAVQAAAVEELVNSRSRELEAQANTDPLTGLYNLRYMQRQLRTLLDLHKRYDHPFAVLLIDIDGLKRINDSGGHAAGDRALIQVAASLRRSIRSVDTPARIGGDEFCVLAPEQDAKGAIAIADRLVSSVREQPPAPDAPLTSLSIGVSACPEHGDDGEVLLDVADRAMYRAKAAGQGHAVGDTGGGAVAEGANRPV